MTTTSELPRDPARTCCFVGEDGGCEAPAEFEIYGVGEGLDPYSNVTETCEKHVGALLGIPVDEYERGLRIDHWRVVPIGGWKEPKPALEGATGDPRLPSGMHVPICFQFCQHSLDAGTELRCVHPAHGAEAWRVIAALDEAGHWDFSACGDSPDWCPLEPKEATDDSSL